MATISNVREYHGLLGVSWLELKHGDAFAAQMLLTEDDDADTPINLTGFVVELLVEHVLIDVTQTAVTTLVAPGGITVNAINPALDADEQPIPDTEVAVTIEDQSVAANHGKIHFAIEPTPLPNPDFGQSLQLPGAIVWLRITKGDGISSMPFAIFYRRGAEL